MTEARRQERAAAMPLRESDNHWRAIFNRYDVNHDGRISLAELRNVINSPEFAHDIPDHVVQKIMLMADRDHSGSLDFEEFMYMMQSPVLKSVFGQYMNRYINTIIPRKCRRLLRQRNLTVEGRPPPDETDGLYEDEYSCFPPPLCMILISIVEVILFSIDAAKGAKVGDGPMAYILIYNPYKRYEAWRFFTYMFVHIGVFHLVVNLAVQILLGIPLEMVHKWWRVVIIYLAGVVAGSLGTSITDPWVMLAGASGGVYALITAHIATIIMNWREMEFAVVQLLVFLIIIVSDVGTAIYNRYVLSMNQHIGYVAHFAGALAGLLVGINILRNIEQTNCEKYVWWASLIVYLLLMGTAIVWNVAYPSYFPPSRYEYS